MEKTTVRCRIIRKLMMLGVLVAGLSTPAAELWAQTEAMQLQEVSLDPVRLEDFIREASESNPEILAAKNRWEAARRQIVQAWSLPDPVAGIDVMGEMTETRVGPQDNRMMVSQEIPFPLKLWKRRQAAKENAAAAYEEYRAVEREVRYRLQSAFYGLYEADTSIRVIQDIHDVLKKAEGTAQSLYAKGEGSQRDAAKAQVETSMTLEQLYELQVRQESFAAEINMLLNRDPLERFGAPVKPEKPELGKTMPELVRLAEENREEILRARALVRKGKAGKALARMENIPDLQAGFSYTWVGSGMTEDPEDGKNSWMFPLAVNIPLWQPRVIAMIQEAENELRAAMADEQSAENQAAYEIRAAFARYSAASRITTLYETAIIPQAEVALRSDQAGYEAGKTDFLNLLDSERVYLNANLGYAKIYTEMLRGFAELQRVSGFGRTEGDGL